MMFSLNRLSSSSCVLDPSRRTMFCDVPSCVVSEHLSKKSKKKLQSLVLVESTVFSRKWVFHGYRNLCSQRHRDSGTEPNCYAMDGDTRRWVSWQEHLQLGARLILWWWWWWYIYIFFFIVINYCLWSCMIDIWYMHIMYWIYSIHVYAAIKIVYISLCKLSRM